MFSQPSKQKKKQNKTKKKEKTENESKLLCYPEVEFLKSWVSQSDFFFFLF